MINTAKLKLNTGATIPQLGLGTHEATDEECYNAVLTALKAGYRHIDTAPSYRNERPVGKAIRDSGIPREEIFVTTKLFQTQHREAEIALDESLERLGLEYVDLYLMHWPFAFKRDESSDDKLEMLVKEDGFTKYIDDDDGWNFIKTWELMQPLFESGKAKAIGVSNFSIKNLEDLAAAETTTITPAANQCECHPLLPQNELIEYCKSKSIVFEAFSPLGTSKSTMLTNKTLKEIAESYGVSVGEVMINWAFQRGHVVLPKSSNPTRIANNARVLDLKKGDFDKVSDLVKVEGVTRLNQRRDAAPFPVFE